MREAYQSPGAPRKRPGLPRRAAGAIRRIGFKNNFCPGTFSDERCDAVPV